MTWNKTFIILGKPFEVSTARWEGPMRMIQSGGIMSIMSIMLTAAEIDALDDSELIQVLRKYAEDAEELATIGRVFEVGYNDQFVKYDDLIVVLESDYASEDDKAKAIQALTLKTLQITLKAVVIEKSTRSKSRKERPGYVYVIQSENGLCKIGRTIDLDSRFSSFESLFPVSFEPICIISSNNPYSLESDLHERFATKRQNGEWFSLDAQDIAYIQSIPND